MAKTGPRFSDIGDRLRTYRIASGRSVDDLAARLGVSRAAVYRYEKGEVVKIETVQKLANLLQVPMTALLGIDIEFVSDGIVFFERIRQIEARALSSVIVFGPIAYMLTSDEYDEVLREALTETFPDVSTGVQRRLDDLLTSLRGRKETFRARRMGLVSISSVPEIERFLATGLVARRNPSARLVHARRSHAVREVRHIAQMLRSPQMGVQIGVLTEGLPVSGFQIIREMDRSRVVNSPFRVVDIPNVRYGVASIIDMEHVVQMHEDIANRLWTSALTDVPAAQLLEDLADRAEADIARAALSS
ncbi:helix-turn-helix domain-containing protein [Salipiger sp. PrR002]|uniref:helix-turn-helix domain-containing protein n=1 Tax=Salipiger sp. PrR002 TaxID=2706489 RepID=UPI0013B99101|nr:helix-turn-helix domain-containing protein [Salipiger sp. PrR002]NDW01991.1 helix-turn-helix domain-containing protein [Salipiger sp. PrR002]NDW59031.1 helix-turn-helix domain-containing protein [Salipiger sp. PrR004]